MILYGLYGFLDLCMVIGLFHFKGLVRNSS